MENITGPGLNMTAGQPILNMTAGQPILKTVHDYLLVVLLVAVMFAMGCHITWEQVSLFFNNYYFLCTFKGALYLSTFF